ncbi:Glycosyltransferase involved in cell wall bisynthesis [Methylomagnum ishizawai]|uniref:Glycosyltransferase involved in cell wall bisynthesis n=1 Tax=Methylomagnum ishizawai TaxID=1760988 RepID=A0A1Y6CWL5_9GAMM|nr:glycosyltransferase [Methylomagnum ishizawai]SMF95048.1 Glycosyltransferase involved in cell wall bisynthesis [Methylomagnum ishizawai]
MSNPADHELVSVVIPAYKHASYIVAALSSVAEQTYPNLELVIVDDCSPDATLEVAAEWLSSPEVDSRFASVLLLKNETNSGAHASINRGILESKGAVISLMNSDDLYHPERISKLVAAIKINRTEFAFSRVRAIDDDNMAIPPWRLPDSLRNVFDFADQVSANFPALSFGFLAQNMAVSTGNFVFKRELYERIGQFKPLLYVHDWEFVLRAIFECEPAYVDEDLYLYRIHNTNSFSQLSHVGEIEGLIVAELFYRLSRNKAIRNILAPVPDNWPTVWEIYKERLLMLNVGSMAIRQKTQQNKRVCKSK